MVEWLCPRRVPQRGPPLPATVCVRVCVCVRVECLGKPTPPPPCIRACAGRVHTRARPGSCSLWACLSLGLPRSGPVSFWACLSPGPSLAHVSPRSRSLAPAWQRGCRAEARRGRPVRRGAWREAFPRDASEPIRAVCVCVCVCVCARPNQNEPDFDSKASRPVLSLCRVIGRVGAPLYASAAPP